MRSQILKLDTEEKPWIRSQLRTFLKSTFFTYCPNLKVLISLKISSALFFGFTSLAAISLYFLPETNGITLAQTLEEAEIRFRKSKISHSRLVPRGTVPGQQCRESGDQALENC